MTVPVSAILYKLRTTYSRFKFDVAIDNTSRMFIVGVHEKGKKIGSKSFKPDMPMDKFWSDIKDWMRTLVRQ
jgi:hypothetical protein